MNCFKSKGTLFFIFALFQCFLLSACREPEGVEPLKKSMAADTVKAQRSREDYEEAIVNFKNILEKDPDNIIILISLGNAYFDLGMDEKAIETYKKALKIYPDNVSVRTDLGTAYRRTGKPDKALEEYARSLAIDPRHSISRYNTGVVLFYDKKDIQGTIKVWEELLQIDPYFVGAEELRNNLKILRDMTKSAGR